MAKLLSDSSCLLHPYSCIWLILKIDNYPAQFSQTVWMVWLIQDTKLEPRILITTEHQTGELVYLGASYHSTPTAYSCHIKHVGVLYKNSCMGGQKENEDLKRRIVNEIQKWTFYVWKILLTRKWWRLKKQYSERAPQIMGAKIAQHTALKLAK